MTHRARYAILLLPMKNSGRNRWSDDRPVYSIGIVSDVISVHPETIRVWERHGIVRPVRRNRHRMYSATDVKRLDFIRQLLAEGLNLVAVRRHLTLYPCWWHGECPPCMNKAELMTCAKPCWKEEGTYCSVSFTKPDPCTECQFRQDEYLWDR